MEVNNAARFQAAEALEQATVIIEEQRCTVLGMERAQRLALLGLWTTFDAF